MVKSNPGLRRDMRYKKNKQVLGTAANRDAYVQQKSVVLHDSTKREEKPVEKKGEAHGDN
jgi:hypothetical protein